jgi:hypothetical protein
MSEVSEFAHIETPLYNGLSNRPVCFDVGTVCKSLQSPKISSLSYMYMYVWICSCARGWIIQTCETVIGIPR